MYRQYSSRNQRNKGMKVKHALQICVFLAVCFWLIYQVKHSHDKKKEFEESDVDDPLDRGSIGGLIKIGRKEIRPLFQEVVTVDEQHNQAAEEEETTKVENIHEEDRSPVRKFELDTEASKDGDDETDEHEIEKSEASRDREVDQEEDSITDGTGENGIDSETGEISDDGNGRKQESFVENGGRDGDDETDEHETKKSEASRDREVDQEEDNITDDAGENGIESGTGEVRDDGNGRKQESFVENGGRDGDDETDEHETEKSEASRDREVDQEEDNITDDDAGENGIESGTGEVRDDGNGRKQESFVENGGRDGDDENHEAREEFYKADDASSAVSHDNHTQTTENESKFVRISGNLHGNMLDLENNANHGEEANNGQEKERLEVDSGEESEDAIRSSATDNGINAIAIETKENNLESSEKNSTLNNTLTEASNDPLVASNYTTDVTTQNARLSEQNMPELDHGQGIVTEDTSAEGSNQANNSTMDVENHLSLSNSTDHTESINSESNLEDFLKPSNDTDTLTDTDSFTVVRITRSEHALEDGANAQKNEIISAKSVLESAIIGNDNPKEVHIDSTDLSSS